MPKYRIVTLFGNNEKKISEPFEIPQEIGKYKVIAHTDRGKSINCGEIKVGNVEHNYRLNINYSSTLYQYFDIKTPAITLDTMSWSKLKDIANSGTANEILEVGATKNIILTTGEEVELALIGINHDTKSSGSQASLTFYMNNILSTQHPMGEYATSWSDSDIRNIYLPQILQTLPSDLQEVIADTKKQTDGVETTDKLFLLSYQELMGTKKAKYDENDIIVGEEGQQYEYFANANIPICQDPTFYNFTPIKEDGKGSFWAEWNGEYGSSDGFLGFIDKYGKKIYLSTSSISNGNITKTKQNWNEYEENAYWLRSRHIQYSGNFVIIGDGRAYSSFPEYNSGIAFAFCI